MSSLISTRQSSTLRRAAVRATYAPSVHNTQPWRLQVRADSLTLYADRTRRLPVLDPTSRQLVISCGCALLNARVALAADGLPVDVVRYPDSSQPDLLARITPSAHQAVDPELAGLDHVLELRHTNRREFANTIVPEDLLERLEQAALIEGARLHVVRDPDQRLAVAMLSQRADDIENLNPAYRAELRAWTNDDGMRRDGVAALAVPHVNGTSEDDIPLRDFDTTGAGGLPAHTHSHRDQCLVLLCTDGDVAGDWLRAGEALERVLLEITRFGFVASPLTQITEVPSARTMLRRELGMTWYPHLLLRIGRAPATPNSRRRRLVDVIVDET